jgi:hypothetical protein
MEWKNRKAIDRTERVVAVHLAESEFYIFLPNLRRQ